MLTVEEIPIPPMLSAMLDAFISENGTSRELAEKAFRMGRANPYHQRRASDPDDDCEYGCPYPGAACAHFDLDGTVRNPRPRPSNASPYGMLAETVEAFIRYLKKRRAAYPEDIFIPPAPGQHGKTVDGCSAAALRWFIDHVVGELETGSWAAKAGPCAGPSAMDRAFGIAPDFPEERAPSEGLREDLSLVPRAQLEARVRWLEQRGPLHCNHCKGTMNGASCPGLVGLAREGWKEEAYDALADHLRGLADDELGLQPADTDPDELVSLIGKELFSRRQETEVIRSQYDRRVAMHIEEKRALRSEAAQPKLKIRADAASIPKVTLHEDNNDGLRSEPRSAEDQPPPMNRCPSRMDYALSGIRQCVRLACHTGPCDYGKRRERGPSNDLLGGDGVGPTGRDGGGVQLGAHGMATHPRAGERVNGPRVPGESDGSLLPDATHDGGLKSGPNAGLACTCPGDGHGNHAGYCAVWRSSVASPEGQKVVRAALERLSEKAWGIADPSDTTSPCTCGGNEGVRCSFCRAYDAEAGPSSWPASVDFREVRALVSQLTNFIGEANEQVCPFCDEHPDEHGPVYDEDDGEHPCPFGALEELVYGAAQVSRKAGEP